MKSEGIIGGLTVICTCIALFTTHYGAQQVILTGETTNVFDRLRAIVPKGTQSKDVNINTALAGVVGRLLIEDYTRYLQQLGDFNASDLLIGDNQLWRERLTADHQMPVNKCENSLMSPRHIYALRHSERLNYGSNELKHLDFVNDDLYIRRDLNSPIVLPKRDWRDKRIKRDEPLSMVGHTHAWIIGHSLKHMNITISHVYSSPALRCVETANTLLFGAQSTTPINIEPGLLEWHLLRSKIKYLDADQLIRFRINVNKTYKPIIPFEKLNKSETRLGEYGRGFLLARSLLKRHKEPGANILLIGHLSATEVLTRQLVGHKPLPIKGYDLRVFKKPFGLMTVAEEDCSGNGSWHKIVPPIQPIAMHVNHMMGVEDLLKIVVT